MSFFQSMARSIGKPILNVNRNTEPIPYQNPDMVMIKVRLGSLGARLRFARKQAGMTQKQLAKKVGMSQSNMSELENNQYPSSSYTAQLADALGVSGIWLAEGRGPQTLTREEDRNDIPEKRHRPPPSDAKPQTSRPDATEPAPARLSDLIAELKAGPALRSEDIGMILGLVRRLRSSAIPPAVRKMVDSGGSDDSLLDGLLETRQIKKTKTS